MVKKVLALLDRHQRRVFVGLFGAMALTGLIQVAGVGSILPFVEVLTQRQLVLNEQPYRWLYALLGFESPQAFVFWFGVAVFALLVLGNAFLLFTQWLIARATWRLQRDLSKSLLARYLAQPYAAHLGRNSADYGKNILQETQQLANGVLRPALTLVAGVLTAVAIGGLLVAVNPALAGVVAVLFGTAYALIYGVLRRWLLKIGQRRVAANTGRFQAVNEAFGSLKEVKVLGREPHFLGRYGHSAHGYADSMALQQILTQVPRYAVEAVGFGSAMLIVLFLMQTDSGLQGVLPLLSTYALAGYRLLPAFQQIYQGVSNLRFNQAAVDAVFQDYMAMSATAAPQPSRTPLAFRDEIRLEHVFFTYPAASTPALIDVTLTIPRRGFVAFVGTTGAGKSTLADVLLGILHPDTGRFLVDGVPVDESNRRAWQANLGYVPQEIYLADDTVSANIAFGVFTAERDQQAVERAARDANIHTFITEELPQGYRTRVGERGVRLSGGQRQRIGIARALYHDPEVLVLDEATSALDGATEAAVHRAILRAAAVKTVVLVAHRLQTVQDCHRVFLLEHGRLTDSGTYDEVIGDRQAISGAEGV